MNAQAEMDLDLADRTMGGYGVEEELERLRQKEKIREAKLAAEEGLGRDDVDEKGNPPEGSLTLEEYIMPTVQNSINALGGWEEVEDEVGNISKVYRPGDNIVGCLNDIFKLSRLDEEDDGRTVARTFAKTNLMAELVTIIVELSDEGAFGKKVGSKAARLIARLTWPIDVASELMEADDIAEVNPDFSSLLRSQLEYKALLLRPGKVLEKLMDLLLPNLTNPTTRDKEKIRQEGEVQALLYIIRNLAMIKDAPASTSLSADNVEKASLQSRLIEQLETSDFLPLLITLASSSNAREFNQYNVLILDIVHLLWRGVSPADLCRDQKVVARENLSALLEKEDLGKLSASRNSSSRHSRFGATVSVQADDGRRVVLSKGAAVRGDVGKVMDLSKKRGKLNAHSAKMVDANGKVELQGEAALILKSFSEEFVRTAFNTFVASILNDIRREESKVKDKDNLRLAQVCSFIVEFFTLSRQLATDKIVAKTKAGEDVADAKAQLQAVWNFGYLAEFCDMTTIIHLNKRLYMVMEDSPPGWVEIEATCHCFCQLLLLLDSMGSSGEEASVDAAQVLQHKIYYNAELLERPIKLLMNYKNQSTSYLDTVIHFSYVLLRMLERHSKENAHNMVIRRLKRGGKKKQVRRDLDSDQEDEDDYVESNVSKYSDHLFKFGEFEQKWRDERVLHTCLVYLERYEEFTSPDQMKRVVNILHRIAVRLKTEGMFFKVSILNLFKHILDNQATLPRGPASKELLNLIKYLLRQFFKEAEKSAFIIVEALFPKNRNQWQAHSTWTKEEDSNSSGTDQGQSRVKRAPRMPAEVQVKDKSLSVTQQIGVAVGALLESEQMALVTWTIETLKDASAARNEIVFHTDGLPPVTSDLTDEEVRARMTDEQQPSEDALAKFTAHSIMPDSDVRKDAVTNNSQLKLLFRLLDFKTEGLENEPPLQWFIPMDQKPTDLEANARIIELFIREPVEVEGDTIAELLMPKRRAPKGGRRAPRQRQRAARTDPDGDSSAGDDDNGLPRAARARRKKKVEETKHYKSAAWIEDSDDDVGDTEFFAREAEAIARKEAEVEAGISTTTMQSQGTKKRKVLKDSAKRGGKRRRGSTATDSQLLGTASDANGSMSDDEGSSRAGSSVRASSERQASTIPTDAEMSDATASDISPVKKQRPMAKPRFQTAPMLLPTSDDDEPAGNKSAEDDEDEDDEIVKASTAKPNKRRVVLEDSEEEV